jgi:bifunctional enzyme CysN/CysC
MKQVEDQQKMNIVIAGHVDHGKSTVVGRLLADTGSLPLGKLEQVKSNCERNSKPFEYAFLIDALKDEQSQGITIDAARVFFKTAKRHYIIIDAPGHIEFLKNMVTGAARAEAALLVIDAEEGVRENSKRHGYMLSMLGIRQIAVLVNKMDLVAYDRQIFGRIVKEYAAFLNEIRIRPAAFIPVSGIEGDNIAAFGRMMPWHAGDTVLSILDGFEKEKVPADKPFRMPVQDVYKFTKFGDNRRIVAGTIESGFVSAGDEIVFYPSGKRSRVKSIEAFNREPQLSASTGEATGLALEEQIYITRGEIAVKAGEPRPKITTGMRASIFWLGREPMVPDKDYILKLATARVPVRLEAITRVIDASDLKTSEGKDYIERHDVAECTLKMTRAAAFDIAEDMAATGRFVIVDGYEIAGGGIILRDVEDRQTWVRDKVLLRNYKWERSSIPMEDRAEKYNQMPTLIVITGEKDSGKKPLAKKLESRLFADGKIVYFLGIGNVLYGVDADIKGTNNRQEHLRRLAEVAHIMLDVGVILIVTATRLTQEDLDIIKTIVNPERIEVIWLGENVTTDISIDSKIPPVVNLDETVDSLKADLQEKGIIFKPW